MKARAIANVLNETMRRRIGASEIIRPRFSLTEGKSYLVLGIYFSAQSDIYGRTTLLRIIDDDGTCIVCPVELFEICDGRPSRFWRARIANADFFLYPEEFFDRYFFDDLVEKVPSIVSRFENVVQLLEAEHAE